MSNGTDFNICPTCEHSKAVMVERVPNGYYRCPFKKNWQLCDGSTPCDTGAHKPKQRNAQSTDEAG